ncbi:UNVERIFIED_CONTAM: Retrovirus-related Pol polyprotein from transposon TNT 1-94 [Sesamum latifolium]|uniref:Retrovirus-related Pol polyprotein from transposon TNT 1-94 n=1 Tax=Sesamum latifolium TaxID=2727402 RepID=A0AAW2VEQ4_9LAMI
MINSLLLTSGLSKYLWGEALNTACHILNRVPLKYNTSIPFELWKGYVETSYAMRFLIIKSEIRALRVNTIVEFCDAVFLEDVFSMKIGTPSSVSLDDSLASTSIPEHVENISNVGVNPSSTSLTHEESDESRRSKRARVVKDFESNFVTYNIQEDPVTFKDVMASLKTKQWKEAVKSEMDSIVSNRTWVLVDLPLGCTTIACKWIFKKKLKPNGFVDKFKVRLVAKDFKQNEGIDYFDTYSPIAQLITIQVLIALASVYSFPIHQDMGEADVILGIKLIRSTNGIAISHSHYVEKIIKEFGNHNSRIAKTPYDSSVALFKNESGVPVAQLRTHWGALDRVLRYLKGTVSLVIHYGRYPIVLEGYSDWIAKNSRNNGCSGYVFTLGGGTVSWKSAKQTLITRSSFKVELYALGTSGTEAEWLFGLLSQLPIVSQPLPPIVVHCDSQTTIPNVRSHKYNQKTKRYIQFKLKSIRAFVSERVIRIDFVGTKDNVVDPLTKGLDLSQVYKFKLGIGLKNPSMM